jgi:hypothetical protein
MRTAQLSTHQTVSPQYDRLEWHLHNWARWMRAGGLTRFRIVGGHGLRGFTHYSHDREAEDAQSDTDTAVRVDAVIRDLSPAEREALQADYLGAVWRCATPLHLVLVLARERVGVGIRRLGIL